MGNNFKDTDIKNSTYYFFDDMISTKSLDPNKDESVNPLYLITKKTKRCFKEINGNKYLMLVPTDKTKK